MQGFGEGNVSEKAAETGNGIPAFTGDRVDILNQIIQIRMNGCWQRRVGDFAIAVKHSFQ